jgi:hypothetical protein
MERSDLGGHSLDAAFSSSIYYSCVVDGWMDQVDCRAEAIARLSGKLGDSLQPPSLGLSLDLGADSACAQSKCTSRTSQEGMRASGLLGPHNDQNMIYFCTSFSWSVSVHLAQWVCRGKWLFWSRRGDCPGSWSEWFVESIFRLDLAFSTACLLCGSCARY